MKYRVLVVIAAISGVIAGVKPLSAQFATTVYAASECKQDSANGTLSRTVRGRLQNLSSTDALGVICPIIRETTTATITEVKVTVQDLHSSAVIDCDMKCYEDSDTTAEFISSGSYQSSSGYNTLTIPSSDITEYNDGRCFLYCSIPVVPSGSNYSELISYYVD